MLVSASLVSPQIECEAWEAERDEMKAEATLLKEQLQSLQSELEKLPYSKRHCSEVVSMTTCSPSHYDNPSLSLATNHSRR